MSAMLFIADLIRFGAAGYHLLSRSGTGRTETRLKHDRRAELLDRPEMPHRHVRNINRNTTV